MPLEYACASYQLRPIGCWDFSSPGRRAPREADRKRGAHRRERQSQVRVRHHQENDAQQNAEAEPDRRLQPRIAHEFVDLSGGAP